MQLKEVSRHQAEPQQSLMPIDQPKKALLVACVYNPALERQHEYQLTQLMPNKDYIVWSSRYACALCRTSAGPPIPGRYASVPCESFYPQDQHSLPGNS